MEKPRRHAVILTGFARNTVDVDLLIPSALRSAWLDLMREMGFRIYHGTTAFAQFEPAEGGSSVDMMFVEEATWKKLSEEPVLKTLAGQPL